MDKNYYIYSHTSPSGKVYIGQTVNIEKRWGYNGEHYMSKKKDGSYVQRLFARAIQKYGWDNFEHKVILEGISKSKADYSEKYLIKWYKLHNLSYNITDGGEGVACPKPPLSVEARHKISEYLKKNHPMKGKHWPPEQLARITEANRSRIYTPEQRAAMAERARFYNTGRKRSEESKKKLSDYKKAHPETWIGGWNKKEVHQYDINGNYIQSFDSAEEAARSIGKKSCGDICKCLNGRCASAHGYIWKLEKVESIDLTNYKIVKTAHGARLIDMSDNGRRKRRDGHGKPINQYSLDGKYLMTYNSITDAKEVIGYKGSGIEKCCKHIPRYKSAGGYLWEYDVGDNRKDLNYEDDVRLKEKQIEKTGSKKS